MLVLTAMACSHPEPLQSHMYPERPTVRSRLVRWHPHSTLPPTSSGRNASSLPLLDVFCTLLILLCSLSHYRKPGSLPPWSLFCSPETCSLFPKWPLHVILPYLMSPVIFCLKISNSTHVYSTCYVSGPIRSTLCKLTYLSLTSVSESRC